MESYKNSQKFETFHPPNQNSNTQEPYQANQPPNTYKPHQLDNNLNQFPKREFIPQQNRGENSKPEKKNFTCHSYQFGECKKGDLCAYTHPEKPAGACVDPVCNLCDRKSEIKYCTQERCPEFYQEINLKIDLVFEALKTQLDFTNKRKYELQDLLGTESETKEALVIKLKQCRQQRSDFIRVIHKKLSKFLEQPNENNLHNLMIIEKEAQIFKRCLPAYSVCQDVKSELYQKENRFCLISGDTGSGKSTQVPQFLYLEVQHLDKRILVVQPRKLAAMHLAARVAEELGVTLGKEVGYQVGPGKPPTGVTEGQYTESKFSNDTKILFMTESVLLERLRTAYKAPEKGFKFFRNVKAILMDEVHERTLYSELIFGNFKKQQFPEHFDKIKIFLASATINKDLFQQYFNNCRAIEIPGQTFPAQIKYKPMFEENYIQGTVEVLKEIVKQKRSGNTDYQGHVLVFLTCFEEMLDVERRIYATFPKEQFEKEYVIRYLHGKLSSEKQQEIFKEENPPKSKIILATKIAESSITINGVRIVIDSGYDKDSSYDSQNEINVLEIDWISQASAKQRMGRAGRTAPGICFRLYSEDTFQKFELHKRPEISKINLERAFLKIIDFGLDPQIFPFLEFSEKQMVERTMTALRLLEALDGQNQLTALGRVMVEMSSEPRKTKAIIMASQRGCLNEMLKVLSMESFASSLLPRDKKEREKAISSYEGYHSDHLDYLLTFQSWEKVKYQDRKDWCTKRFLDGSIMENSVNKMYLDLQKEIYKINKKNPEIESLKSENANNGHGNVAENILKSLLASSIISLSKSSGIEKNGFANILNGALFQIHNTSGQNNYFPQVVDTDFEYVIYSHMENLHGLNKAKCVSFIKSDWLNDRTLISKEMHEKISTGARENYQFQKKEIKLPPWSITLFKKLLKDRINDWMENRKGNKSRQSLQMTQENDTIYFVYSKDLSSQVENLCKTLKEELDQNISNKNLIYNIKDTNYTPIITEGLGVSEILFAGEFNTLSYQVNGKKDQSQVRSLLGLRETDIQYLTAIENQQKTTGNLRFKKKHDAGRFYESFKKRGEFKLEPVFYCYKKVQMFGNCKIKASFSFAESLRSAKIAFENSEDVEEVMKRLKRVRIDGAAVTTKIDPNNKYAFNINGLSPETDEFILKNYVMGTYGGVPKIEVHRQHIEGTVLKMLNEEAMAMFNSIFTQYLSPEEISNLTFDYKSSQKYKGVTHATIPMPSKAIALKIMKDYNGEKGVFGPHRMRIKVKNSIALTIGHNIFFVMAPLILAKIEMLKKSQPLIHIELKNPKEKGQDYKVKISGDDNSINRAVAAKIEALTRGEKFSISSRDEKIALFSSTMLGQYPKIQESINKKQLNSCYIHSDLHSKKLKIYSPFTKVRKEVKKRIQEELKKLVTIVTIDLRNYNIKRVEAEIEKTMSSFISQRDSRFELTLDSGAKKVFVKADTDFIQGFKKSIEPFMVPKQSQSPEMCPICLDPLPVDHCTLYKCGHKFCKDHLKEYLESQESKTHLDCPAENCQKTLTLMDIKNVLSDDSMERIIKGHVLRFIRTQYNFYRNCPTPDCCHLFKVGERAYHCQGCFESYCLADLENIHQAHPGVSCAQFQGTHDVDKEFKELIQKGEVKITNCCKVVVVRDTGCNHIVCPQCAKHYCYQCLKVFNSQGETYQHSQTVHRGLN